MAQKQGFGPRKKRGENRGCRTVRDPVVKRFYAVANLNLFVYPPHCNAFMPTTRIRSYWLVFLWLIEFTIYPERVFNQHIFVRLGRTWSRTGIGRIWSGARTTNLVLTPKWAGMRSIRTAVILRPRLWNYFLFLIFLTPSPGPRYILGWSSFTFCKF